MTIFVDAHVFDHGYEGSRSYLEGLYTKLTEAAPGITFIFGSSDVSGLQAVFGNKSNVKYVKYHSTNRLIRLLLEIPLIELKYRPDYSHFQYVTPVIKISRTIVTIHDVLFLDYPQYFPAVYKFLRKWLFRRSARRADLLLTVSEYSRGRILTLLPLKKNPVHLIPNGINDRFINNQTGDNIEIVHKYGLGRFILSVGRFEPRKNQIMLLNAFLELELSKKGYKLVFIGKASLRYIEFTNLLNSLPCDIRKSVLILDSIPDNEMPEFYRSCEIFVYPSHAEGFGLPPLEAYACGAKVIVSENTALADFLFLKEGMICSADISSLKNKMSLVLDGKYPKNQHSVDLKDYSWDVSAASFLGLLSSGLRPDAGSAGEGRSRLKVAILGTRGIPAAYGGFETFAEELSVRLVEKGIESFVYCERRAGGEEIHRGVNLRYAQFKKQGNQLRYYLHGLRWASGFADIILNAGTGGALFYKIRKSSRQVLITNMDGLEHKRGKWPFWARWFLHLSERLSVKYSDFLIADSQAIGKYLTGKYPDHKNKIRVISYGASAAAGKDDMVLTEMGLDKGQYFLVVARLEPENNIDIIIEGFLRSRSRHKLVIVGAVMNNKYCKSLLRRSNESIIFAGGIFDKERLATLRHHARAYLHGHSVGGTNPSLLESMAQGSLCICHDNPFNREVTNNDQYYFTDSQSLAEAISGLDKIATETIRNIRRRNQNRIETFYSWDIVATQYSDLFEETARSIYGRDQNIKGL